MSGYSLRGCQADHTLAEIPRTDWPQNGDGTASGETSSTNRSLPDSNGSQWPPVRESQFSPHGVDAPFVVGDRGLQQGAIDDSTTELLHEPDIGYRSDSASKPGTPPDQLSADPKIVEGKPEQDEDIGSFAFFLVNRWRSFPAADRSPFSTELMATGFIRTAYRLCSEDLIGAIASVLEVYIRYDTTPSTFNARTSGRFVSFEKGNTRVLRPSSRQLGLGGSIAMTEFPLQARTTNGHLAIYLSTVNHAGVGPSLAFTNTPAEEITNINGRDSKHLWRDFGKGQIMLSFTRVCEVFMSCSRERKLVQSDLRRGRNANPKRVVTIAVCENGCVSVYSNGVLDGVIRPDEQLGNIIRAWFRQDVFGLVDFHGECGLIEIVDPEFDFDTCCQ